MGKSQGINIANKKYPFQFKSPVRAYYLGDYTKNILFCRTPVFFN